MKERLNLLEKVKDDIILDFDEFKPYAAPDDCNLWIDVWWIPWTEIVVGDTPDGYKIYRSFNNEDYELAGTVKGAEKMSFRDKSSKLIQVYDENMMLKEELQYNLNDKIIEVVGFLNI